MKKILVILALCLAFVPLPQDSRAASSSLEVVLVDSLWGAGIGALAGAATLAFMDHPSDHYERIYQGAAIGLFIGLGFGIYELSPMFYSYTTPAGKKETVYGLMMRIPLQ
jgi:RsiW-degrading membrane proteinase PrsW (M82 family)